jgi:hypothetical protein
MFRIGFNIFCCAYFFSVYSQQENESLPYQLYDDQLVIYSNIGYNSAPFRIRDDIGTVRYRNNMDLVLGVGGAYKWLDLSLNFKLPGSFRDPNEFGTTTYFDFDIGFKVQQFYFNYDLHIYKGFRAEKSGSFVLQNDLSTFSTSIGGYYFLNPAFQFQPFQGITGRYSDITSSFYVKGTTNLHGMQHLPSLLPLEFVSDEKSIWKAHRNTAFDLGILPGVAFVGNWKGWQAGALLGLGGVIQNKYYRFDNTTRGFLGLAPRIDFQAHLGYNQEKWFLMLHADLDNKQIQFNSYRFRQIYYFIRITGGFRFPSSFTEQLPVDLPDL